MLTSWTSYVNFDLMPSIVNKKAGKRRAGEPDDRHSIHIKLNDQEFEQAERDLAAASSGPGGAVRHGSYAKNAYLSHAKLFAFRETVSSLVRDPDAYHKYHMTQLVDLLRSALDA